MARKNGFSLVELVVIVMVIGILVAVCTAKFLNVSEAATDNGLRRTLTVVRGAIERYAVEHGGEWPGASDNTQQTFKADLAPYLRASFPTCPVGPANNNQVRIKTNPGIMNGESNPAEGWFYSVMTGQFICNYNGTSSDGTTYYDRF